jgi:hypothetical protein
MTTVITVVYETEKGIFRFSVEEVKGHIDRYEMQYDTSDVTVLPYSLSFASGDSITIPKELNLFPYVALKLIKGSNGTVS